ncbi:outer membrane protein assembly factor BamE [Maritalea mediterranea]|uniref:Outer membrane protein assembly factor BamE n=1 Tax=Maritalea mediterranea TaxID=2909667 RepID=A0ABS9E5N7_9HYPH|nr:outer membrane protein assembly factor BamE [Maritalea mediterranea]MCF4098183.1 outer membrane protein assembly factor BamE [Maritalea mediterranea]
MMVLRSANRFLSLIFVVFVAVGLSGCLTQQRTQGYDIPEGSLEQVRPGVSKELVEFVLGSPQTTNTFGDEQAYYYVETKVEQTAFGLTSVKSRTVLAVYFDKNDRVTDKAVYGLEDGKVVDIVSRRTPGFGQDRSFLQQLLGSLSF